MDSTVVLDVRVVSGSGGGPDKTILNSPRYLAPAGYHNVCAYLRAPDDPGFEHLRRMAERLGAPLVSIADRGPWDWKVVSELVSLCRRERVRIWHGHDYKSNALGLLVRRFWPMRLVTTVHGWVQITRRTPLYYGIDRLCLPKYEHVICVSEDLHQRCQECGVPAELCETIENGIDLDEYQRRNSVAAAKQRLGLNPDRFLIGAVGRLSGEKGFDLLIQAVDRLLNKGLDLSLVILGEGAERPGLERLIVNLGRGDRIQLVGQQGDMPAWYEAMDVFALSSLREGLPNVLLEAMALEVPVIATRIAGIPRLIDDGNNGRLIEPNDLEALTTTLALVLNDADQRAQFARAGRQTVERNYNFAMRMERVRAIYDRLLNRDRAGASCSVHGTLRN